MTVTSRAVRWHGPGDLRLDVVPVRDPGPGEVRVRPAYVGICGSDLHEVRDGPHAIPVTAPHAASGATAPLVLGHEFSAVVETVGPGVTEVRPGDPVAVEPNYRCGRCVSCSAGRYHTCESFGFLGLMGDGGLADHAMVPEYMLHTLPPGFNLVQAALLEPAAVALHAVRRSRLRAGEQAVVVGAGPVGLLVCGLLSARGVVSTVVEPDPARRALATAYGASAVVDPTQVTDVATAVRVHVPHGAHAAFEVVGAQETLDTALRSVRSGGTVVLLGLAGTLHFDAFALVNAEVTIRPSVGYNDCHPELIELVRTGALDLAPLVGDVIGLADAVPAVIEMASGLRNSLKLVVRCSAIGEGDEPVETGVSLGAGQVVPTG